MTYSTFAYLAGASAARHRFGSGSLRRSYRRGAIAKIYAPPTAQFGEVQAVQCAANITARLAGRPSQGAAVLDRTQQGGRGNPVSSSPGLSLGGCGAAFTWYEYQRSPPTRACSWNGTRRCSFRPTLRTYATARRPSLLRRPPGVYYLTASFPNYRSSESRPAEAGTEGVTATRKPLRTQAR
jgi:hypothetical protein